MGGMYAQVQVTAAKKEFATLVPREAVGQQQDGPVVFVADNGKAEARSVKLGLSDDSNQEILGGVTAGDQIVIQGQNSLKDGQSITVPGASGEGSRESGAQRPNR